MTRSTQHDFGVLYGQKTTEDALLIYSSYDDAKASPQTGDFIVLTPKNEDGRKFLARVEAEIYDEDPIFRNQDKTLIAVHYARISERELSDRDKQKMFSYTYKVKILGTFEGDGKNFTTAVRKLPVVSYHARHLKPREAENILNKTNEKGTLIGTLCIGEDQHSDTSILFDTDKLREKRTMVFAQSGFGKTNLMKVLIHNTINNAKYGKLIFDLNGEYSKSTPKTYGFGDIDSDAIRKNLIVYSDNNIDPKGRFSYSGKVAINMHKHLSVGDILNFSAGFSEVMKSFLLYLDDNQIGDFVSKIDTYVAQPSLLHRDFSDFWPENKNTKGEVKEDVSARKTILAIRKRLSFLLDNNKGLHYSQSNLVEDVFASLKRGKTVIIDLSLKDNAESSIISTILIRKLFENNKSYYTSPASSSASVINAVVFVEEAQNVLSEEFVRSNANAFVRVAKEGRKFGLGLVAITQRPSAISEEIRTQAENFFVLHMGNLKDIKALVESNINYDGVIAKFIQSETIVGNLYMVSSNQSFAIPVRVSEFEEQVKEFVYSDAQLGKHKSNR
ncbi:ATP-binding protein [Tellurirhabdus bombi]|uniref:ATP-binding protein n=1 Tax=Tellurirhabdus bombi TaxID=2907205 RepID=UPI001F251D7E|nr:ATP-binding protein [Tellurirhabdus bombi]